MKLIALDSQNIMEAGPNKIDPSPLLIKYMALLPLHTDSFIPEIIIFIKTMLIYKQLQIFYICFCSSWHLPSSICVLAYGLYTLH